MFGKKKKKEAARKPATTSKAAVQRPKLCPIVAEAARLDEESRQARKNADKTYNGFFKGKATAEMVKNADAKNKDCSYAFWKYVHGNFTQEEIDKALNDASGPNPKGDFITNLDKITRANQRKAKKAPKKK